MPTNIQQIHINKYISSNISANAYQPIYQLININLNDGNPHNRDADQDKNKDPTHNQKLGVAWPEVRNT